MAVTATSYGYLASNVTQEVTLNSTPEEIATASNVFYAVEIDNSQNTAATYFKAYNVASAPSVGTTTPDLVVKVPAGQTRRHILNGGLGETWGTGLFVCGVTTGGTAGSTAPTNTVKAKIWRT